MQDAWMIVGVVLLAVLVGAAVPVLFQLYSTLRATKALLARLGPKLDDTLVEVREVSRRLNRTGEGLERSSARAMALLDAAGDVGESLRGVRDSLRTAAAVGGALGPALAAAIRALTEMFAGAQGNAGTEEPASEAADPVGSHGTGSGESGSGEGVEA
jgi:ABC-type transporter Mla subunit MlaD